MQLKVKVPKERAAVLAALDDQARRTGRPRDKIVLAALEAYLMKESPKWKTFDLGMTDMPTMSQIYEEILDAHFGPAR